MTRGWAYLSVEILRLWMCDGFDVDILRTFLRDGDMNAQKIPCVMCVLAPGASMTCVVKVGSLWFEVNISFGQCDEHIRSVDQFEKTNIYSAAVVMEYDHVIRYHPTHLEQLSELLYGRSIRWFHRYLRYSTYVSTVDRSSIVLCEILLISSLRAIDWHLEYKYIYSLCRILSYLFEGEAHVVFDIPSALRSVEYLVEGLNNTDVSLSQYDIERMMRQASYVNIHIRRI